MRREEPQRSAQSGELFRSVVQSDRAIGAGFRHGPDVVAAMSNWRSEC